jgi:predicted Zn-dependent protease
MTRRVFLAWLVLSAPLFAHESLHGQIGQMTKRIRADPANAALHLKRGELYRLHEQFELAARDYDRAAALDPQLHSVDLGRGLLWTASGRTSEAIGALQRYVAAEPNHPEGHVALARALVSAGRTSEGAIEYTAALRSAPDPDIGIERAQAFLAAGRADDALRGIDEILARLGPVITLQLTAIDIEVRRGDLDGALRRIDAAIATTPRNEAWLELRGDILTCAGRAAEAHEAYKAALEAIASLPPERRATRAIADRERRLRMAL